MAKLGLPLVKIGVFLGLLGRSYLLVTLVDLSQEDFKDASLESLGGVNGRNHVLQL